MKVSARAAPGGGNAQYVGFYLFWFVSFLVSLLLPLGSPEAEQEAGHATARAGCLRKLHRHRLSHQPQTATKHTQTFCWKGPAPSGHSTLGKGFY